MRHFLLSSYEFGKIDYYINQTRKIFVTVTCKNEHKHLQEEWLSWFMISAGLKTKRTNLPASFFHNLINQC